jgi:hypothetical protein
LSFIAKKQILMTPRELEEWEDLSIEKWKKTKNMKKNNQRKIFLNILDDVKICAKIINILWSYLTKYPTYCIEELYNESKMAIYGQKWLNITFSDEASSQVCLISYPSLFKSFFTSWTYKLFWCFQSLSMLYTLLSYFQIILEKKNSQKQRAKFSKLGNFRAAQTFCFETLFV